MFERIKKLGLRARKPRRGKGRRPAARRAKKPAGLRAALAQRPLLLLAAGAGIGLVAGLLVATIQRTSAPSTAAKPVAASRQVASITPAPEPPKPTVRPASPPPGAVAPSARPPIVRPPVASQANANPAATNPPLTKTGPAVWQQYAKAVPETDGRPMIAIVIDDMGLDKRDAARVIDLPPGITIAFMSYAKDLARQAAAARAAGHELWLHVPMEPFDHGQDAGPNVLKTELSPEENRRRLDWALSQLDGYVGINNHMGSRFTSSEAQMRPVLEEVKSRGLAFLDSRTAGSSVAGKLASQMGLPHIDRDVFIDNDETVGAVLAQLQHTEEVARKHGHALAIGHPHASTIEALLQWLPTLKEKGFVLVPASALLHQEPATAG